MSVDLEKELIIGYTDDKGYYRRRRILPHELKFCKVALYGRSDWYLIATDLDTNTVHHFAFTGVVSPERPHDERDTAAPNGGAQSTADRSAGEAPADGP